MRSKWLAGALLTTAVLVTAGEGTSDRRDRDHRLRLPPAPPPVAGRVLTASAWVRYRHGRAPVNRIDHSGRSTSHSRLCANCSK